MTAIENRFKDILTLAESGDASDLIKASNNLAKIRRINNIEKDANFSTIKDFAPKVIYNLVNSVEQNTNNITNTNILRDIAESIKGFRDWLPAGSVDTDYLSSLQTARGDLLKRARGQKISEGILSQQKGVINNIIANNINTAYQITPQSLDYPTLPPSNQATGIEQQLQGIQDIIDNPPPTGLLNSSQLPPTMQLLSRYAGKIGYKPIGNITGMKSRTYVGLNAVMQDGIQIYKPFPAVGVKMGPTPSIKQTFRYHAGQTIGAWNKYITAEQKFIEFANQVSSKQKRQQFVQNQIRGMNSHNYAAQQLTTLSFYYVYSALKWMIIKASKQLQDKTFDLNWFVTNYQLPPGINNNPIGLTLQNCQNLVKILFGEEQVAGKDNKDRQVIKVFALCSSVVIQKAVIKTSHVEANRVSIKNYSTVRLLQCKGYLKSIGLSDEKILKIIEYKHLEPLITKKVIFPSLYANPQIMSLVDKALQIEKVQQPNHTLWQLTWGTDSIPAHDYVWNKQ